MLAAMLGGVAAISAERLTSLYWANFLLAVVAFSCFAATAYLARSTALRITAIIACIAAAGLILMTGFATLVLRV